MKKNSKIITANVDNIRLNNEDDSITEIEHTLELKEGWNLVAGSILNACEIIDDSNILEKDGGNFLIYKFSENGYTRGYSFQKGIGYWVRSGQDGQIKLKEKTEGIIQDETVETIGKTVVTIIESSNIIDQTNKNIENIVNPNSTQTSEEVKETINNTGSTLVQQAEEGQSLVFDLDTAVEKEDPKLLDDLLDQTRESIASNGRIKKNKRKGKKKLRIVNEVNKFDTMYNNGKSAEKHCGDWSNGNGEYAECSNSLKKYFISMNEVGDAAKKDETGYNTTTLYYKSNSSGKKLPDGNYQINAYWETTSEQTIEFRKLKMKWGDMTYNDKTWLYDNKRNLYTDASVEKDEFGYPTWNHDEENYNFTYDEHTKWMKFFKVQDDANTDDDSLYFGITDEYDSNPELTPKGSFIGVKKDIDWIRYEFKNSITNDLIDILIGVLEVPINKDNYKGTVDLDLKTFEIKDLIVKSSNQNIVDIFNNNSWIQDAEEFNDNNFALHGPLKQKWISDLDRYESETFNYNGEAYNFFIKFSDQVEIKLQNGILKFNKLEYDINMFDYDVFERIDIPDEINNDKFIRFDTTGGINNIWFENQQIDFNEPLDWFEYIITDIGDNNSPLEMKLKLGVSKMGSIEDLEYYSIKNNKLKEIKEIIFETNDDTIYNKLNEMSWSYLENPNDYNYALYSEDGFNNMHPDGLKYNYKFYIRGGEGVKIDGEFRQEQIAFLLDIWNDNSGDTTFIAVLILETPDGSHQMYKRSESDVLNETKLLTAPNTGLTPRKTFNRKGGLNKIYLVKNNSGGRTS